MNLDLVRACCMSFPGATENIQWGNNLVFKVARKMFTIACLDADAPYRLSFKCSPEGFAELTERAGIDPAPYLARAQWVALERFDLLPRRELERLLRDSYDLVVAKLPAKARTKARQPRQPAASRPARRRI